MTDAPKISLSQQIEAVAYAVRRQETIAGGGNVRSARAKSEEQYDLQRLIAAHRTMQWLQANVGAVREFAALKPHIREIALNEAREATRREANANEGATS